MRIGQQKQHVHFKTCLFRQAASHGLKQRKQLDVSGCFWRKTLSTSPCLLAPFRGHPALRITKRGSPRLACSDCLAGPAELRGSGAGVGVAFVGGGADDFLGDFRVETFAPARDEGFLHATVFPGMKGEHGYASAGIEARGEMAEKGFAGSELVVHRDAESLEDAAEAEIPVFTGEAPQGGADGGSQRAGAGEAAGGQGIGEQTGMRLIGVFREQ